jgi:hypothetical protein
MSLQSWEETLVTLKTSSPLQTTFTTAKSVFGVAGTDAAAAAKFTLPANFWTPGKAVNVRMTGAISNIVTTPGTITFQFMLGAVIAWTSGAVQLSTTAHTTLPFWMDLELTCQAEGAGTQAKLIGQGIITSQTINNTAVADSVANDLPTLLLPNTNPALGTGFDSTASQQVDIFAGFSISNAGNGIRVDQYRLRALN